MKKLTELFYIDTERDYINKTREIVIKSVKVIGETKISYLVERFSGCEWRPFKVIKKTMLAKISDCGHTHRGYFKTKEDAETAIWIDNHKYKISEAVKGCNDAELLKSIAHRLKLKL